MSYATGISGVPVSDTQQPRLVESFNRFKNNNAEMASVIYDIEDKLHAILNLRETQKEQAANGMNPSISDFNGDFREQISFMESNYIRLNKILSHLQQII